jgi:hypothetical protein
MLFTKDFVAIRRYLPLLNHCASVRIPRGGETRFGNLRPGFFFALGLIPIQFPHLREPIALIQLSFCSIWSEKGCGIFLAMAAIK